jgi:hypothetical protein
MVRKFVLVFLLPWVASAGLPVLKPIFEITKNYHPHYRAIYEVRVNESICEFYTLDPLRIYWRNAKKNDRVEELDQGEHEKLDPVYRTKTAHHLAFQIKSVHDYNLDYELTVDLVRTGDKCEPLISGQQLKKVERVHVVIKWFLAQRVVVSGIGLNGRPHSVILEID